MRMSRRSIAAVRRSGLAVGLVSGGVLAFAAQAKANLTITPTFESSITSDPNAATIEATINTAISNLESYIATPVNATITFGETNTGLGSSQTFEGIGVPYSEYLSQLKSVQTLSADDNIAIASLGPGTTNNPVNGNAGMDITTPLLRALNFNASPPAGDTDSTILFNSSIVYDSRSSPVVGEYDLESVVAHEMDEVLGVGGSGSQLDGVVEGSNTLTGPVAPLDLFRYSSPGTRSYTTSNDVSSYFSINGGNTNFVYFNQNGAADHSDYGDWGDGAVPADGQPNNPAQVQDAYGSPYEGPSTLAQSEPNIGRNELAALDVVGWNLTAAGSALEATVPSLVWYPALGSNTWDTTSDNWNSGSAITNFYNGANVIFNDNNGESPTHYLPLLAGPLSPASVVVDSSGTYIFNGPGGITGTGSLSNVGAGVLELATVNTYTGGTSVSNGAIIIAASGALPKGPVTISGTGELLLAASTGLVTITSFSMSGTGVFDVENNHVIIDYGSGPDPIASIAALLKTGYNGGAWNGAGGIVSGAAGSNAGYGLGYADAADPGNPAALPAGEIEIKYTLLGDANLSGVVDGTDFGILAANFNKGVSRWDQGDFNYDNVVDGTDFGDLAANFNKGANGASIGEPAYDDPAILAFAAANGLLADVPEPASAGLLLVIAGGALTRRRRAQIQ
jgi:autotransporter-associated beta strand protein